MTDCCGLRSLLGSLQWGLLTCTALVLALGVIPGAAGDVASIYSTHENGTRVACPGYKLNDAAMTAAHRSLPCGSSVRVTNKANGRSVVVKIIDRGPLIGGRVIDLTVAAARAIGITGLGHVALN